MTELDAADVEIEEFIDELSDEELDRDGASGGRYSYSTAGSLVGP